MTVTEERNTGVGEARDDERAEATSSGSTGSSGPVNGSATAEDRESGIDALRQERDEFKDLLLRKSAEFDNYRRRVERERRELSEFAQADLLRDVLPLVDDLERALSAASDTQAAADPTAALQAYRQGVELIHRQLTSLLEKKGVTPIVALGADFDPHLHQAVTQEVSAEHREGQVMEELRRGYKLGDRLLRPAMVKVATRE
jgi:molecular chaperone GrpE